ncbi:MAG: hypothetical protein V2B13_08840 [Pseudomonadota bacterium]
MVDLITAPSLSLSVITLLSLLINAVTIYRWISEKKDQNRINDQAFHMVMGLALANIKRGSMIVNRIKALTEQGKQNEEAMIFLENMYADNKSNIEYLLAAAKALKPEEAQKLPYDGDALLNRSIIENANLTIQANEAKMKQKET